MADLIDRQAAIDAVCKYCKYYYNENVIQSIKEIPSAQQWIPCSERMPEEETDVIVCNANGDIQISRGSHSTEIKDYFIWYTTGWRFGKVIAWMPLPNPYKEDKNG